MKKSVLRKEMKRLRRDMEDKERKIRDEKILKNILNLGSFKNSDWFYIYVSYGTEADTKNIIKYLLELKDTKKIHIAVPKVLGDEMEFFEIDSLDELKEGCMGILEPDNNNIVNIEAVKDNKKAFMVLPGLAFDIERKRVGYGGGFYDKYLDRYGADRFFKAGICYDFQMQKQDMIEADNNDIAVDVVITDRAYY